MAFFDGGLTKLAASVLTKDSPAYVQFYVTARCNLTCEQCNIIYSNADQQECTTDQAKAIAENLAVIGTSVVLLTGGEPFVRRDLPEIAQAMIANGVHPRLQTNGLAKPETLEQLVKFGVRDISISLDTVVPSQQDFINGGFAGSWKRALETISRVNHIFPRNAFCALGCVLSPLNLDHIGSVIEFASRIGWWVSLVPAHTTPHDSPRSFSTYDDSLRFPPSLYPRVREVLDQVKSLRNEGFNVYDSDEYLEDVYRYVTGQPTQWRRRNDGICDAPNLYFAIQPNGDMAPCCDYRLPESVPVHHPDFPVMFRSSHVREMNLAITSACDGCMYGSFPEISISSRFFVPMLKRAKLFLTDGEHRDLVPLSTQELMDAAMEISHKNGLLERVG